MSTTPAIYDCVLTHVRSERIRRDFQHRVYLWLVDLDELPTLPRVLRPLARFFPSDHLGDPQRTLRENIDDFLADNGIDLADGRVLMLANARVLGYVFNPLTVYWCYRADDTLECVVAEVHNTYQERHRYLLRPDSAGLAEVDKEFYVSPFLSMEGRYRMRLPEPGKRLNLTITLTRDGTPEFTAVLTGRRCRADARGVVRAALTRPLMPLWISALIRRHGIALWLRRVPVVPRTARVQQEVAR